MIHRVIRAGVMLAVLAGTMLAVTLPAAAATTQPGIMRITVPDTGQQPLCPVSVTGTRAVITVAGTGDTFGAVCDRDGSIAVWDAVTAPAACAAAWHFHHVNALGWFDGTAVQQAAYYRAFMHAWHLAGQSDPQLRYAVRYYLWTLTRFSQVEAYCGY
jgi:hypothetical protein